MISKETILGVASVITILLLVLGFYPQYNVYKHKMAGEAELANAQYSRQVAVAEARAKMESASLLAEADIRRAEGISRANQIIGASINDKYLQWLWITNLKDQDKTVIYVPSGVRGMPIMEASRLQPTPEQPIVNKDSR